LPLSLPSVLLIHMFLLLLSTFDKDSQYCYPYCYQMLDSKAGTGQQHVKTQFPAPLQLFSGSKPTTF